MRKKSKSVGVTNFEVKKFVEKNFAKKYFFGVKTILSYNFIIL